MFVFGMFLCFFCSVSLAYTTCISLGVYCLIKVFNLNDRITFKGFFVWVFKILGWVCLAALVAAVMFLPGAMALLDQGSFGARSLSSPFLLCLLITLLSLKALLPIQGLGKIAFTDLPQ